jgi:hypothetical protein
MVIADRVENQAARSRWFGTRASRLMLAVQLLPTPLPEQEPAAAREGGADDG